MPEARIALVRLLAEDGEFGQAVACARAVVADCPKHADAYFLLASILRERLADDDLQTMIGLVDKPYHSNASIASLAFGIATVLDGRGRYEQAATFYDVANARQAAFWADRGQAVDLDRDSRIVDAIATSFTPEFFRSNEGQGNSSRLPIFVVGMPRWVRP